MATVLDRVRRVALDIEPFTAPPAVPQAPSDPAPGDGVALYDAMVTDEALLTATRKLFLDGHYSVAVEQAFKLVNNSVKAKCGRTTKDGSDLMHHAFKVDGPALRINRMKTVSERDEQDGYRYVFVGVMSGMRNPRAHEHLIRDDESAALEMLILANHLLRVLGRARKAPKPAAKAS